jgi:flagellar biosynthesis protein FlhA
MVEICKQRAHDLLSIEMPKKALDECRKDYPFVVEEVLKSLSVSLIQKVLKNLLKEYVSIRSLDVILETLTKFSPITKNVQTLTEITRQALAGHICAQYADQNRTIHVLTLEPSLRNVWLKSLEESVRRNKEYSPVILCSEHVRHLVRNTLERKLPEVAVLSVHEIDKNYSIEPIRTNKVKKKSINETEPVNEMDILDHFEKIFNKTNECGFDNFKLEAELKDHLDYVSKKLGISSITGGVVFTFYG